MSDYENVVTQLKGLGTQSSLADIVSSSTALKYAIEADKIRTEIEAKKDKGEAMRFWVPVFAPLIGAAALVATLIFQIREAVVVSKAQQATSEDAAWRNMLKDLEDGYPSSAVAEKAGLEKFHGVPPQNVATVMISLQELRSFFSSSRYGRQAHSLAASLLSLLDRRTLESIYPDFYDSTDWKSFGDLVTVVKSYSYMFTDIDGELSNASMASTEAKARLDEVVASQQMTMGLSQSRSKQVGATSLPPMDPTLMYRKQLDGAQEYEKKISDQESDLVSLWQYSTEEITKFIRDHSTTRPPGVLSLHDVALNGGDWQGVSLKDVDFTNSVIQNTDISGICVCSWVVDSAQLLPTTYEGSKWDGTAWWKSAQVSPDLLGYLIKNYPYKNGSSYAGSPTDQKDYADQVARLQQANAASVTNTTASTPPTQP